MRRLIPALAAIALLTGCASTTSSSDTTGRSSDIITREELDELSVTNVYDAVRQIRPMWLRSRVGAFSAGTATVPIQVYIDRVHRGDITALETIQLSSVYRVEFVRGPEATTKYGTDHAGGVIEIISINRRP